MEMSRFASEAIVSLELQESSKQKCGSWRCGRELEIGSRTALQCLEVKLALEAPLMFSAAPPHMQSTNTVPGSSSLSLSRTPITRPYTERPLALASAKNHNR